jgi:CheY-like chemotaxis protein
MLPRHALIIEDEVLVAMEVEALLEAQGYRSFDIADSVEEALQRAILHPPDLITADFKIVGGTGLEAVEAIEARLGRVPTVFITGNAILLGQTDRLVVDKPISPQRLAQACARATGLAS